jgi:hypothetical protein
MAITDTTRDRLTEATTTVTGAASRTAATDITAMVTAIATAEAANST